MYSQSERAAIKIRLAADPVDLAGVAVDMWLSVARQAIDQKGSARLAICGGSTPRPIFELMAKQAPVARLDWQKVYIFWTDERFVPKDHPDNNFALAASTFLCKVNANAYPIPTDLPTPWHAAISYEQTLLKVLGLSADQVPALDLVMLGMGDDGHIASVMPYSLAVLEDKDLVWVITRLQGHARVTLTPTVLGAARKIMMIVTGRHKAGILKTVLTQRPDPVRFPVHSLWPVLDRMVWLIDQQAASLLDERVIENLAT